MREWKFQRTKRDKKGLLRSLFNIRMPRSAGPEFLEVQDAYLQEEIRPEGNYRFCRTQTCEGREFISGRVILQHCAVDAIVNAGKQPDARLFCTMSHVY